MRRVYLSFLCMFLTQAGVAAVAQGGNPCSTEKVNHRDCTFTLDRRYPVTFPTIQMAHGRKISVVVNNPLRFETLTLDETGATLLPGTDQGAALLKAAIPGLGSLAFPSTPIPGASVAAENANEAALELSPDDVPAILERLDALRKQIVHAHAELDPEISGLRDRVTTVYGQLSQILSPVPRPMAMPAVPPLPAADAKPCLAAHPNTSSPSVAFGTPSPWYCYPDWRKWLLCELRGNCSTAKPTPPVLPMKPAFSDVLGEIVTFQARLVVATPPAPNAVFDQKGFDALFAETKGLIELMPDSNPLKKTYTKKLNKLVPQELNLVTYIATIAGVLPGVQKDFITYYASIDLAQGTLPTTDDMPDPTNVGMIYDPRDASATSSGAYPKFLGRNVTWSVNAVNQIGTSRASVTTAAAKTTLATITVLYANPIFEASAGAIFSFVHNRTFTDETLATGPSAGAVQIQETKTHPEVVPFVAGNWKIYRDFTMPDHRRGAFYGTAYIGLNPYTTLAEYGGGPTLSWRSFMVSAFYERAQDTRLIPGELVGQTVCGATPTSTPPPCATTPAAPTASKIPVNAFGIAIGIRVPTTFAAGTGGISQ